jgi:hypothetical protein
MHQPVNTCSMAVLGLYALLGTVALVARGPMKFQSVPVEDSEDWKQRRRAAGGLEQG